MFYHNSRKMINISGPFCFSLPFKKIPGSLLIMKRNMWRELGKQKGYDENKVTEIMLTAFFMYFFPPFAFLYINGIVSSHKLEASQYVLSDPRGVCMKHT